PPCAACRLDGARAVPWARARAHESTLPVVSAHMRARYDAAADASTRLRRVLVAALVHRGCGLALEPPDPFVHRGATARLQAAVRHFGAGLALEPPGPLRVSGGACPAGGAGRGG